MIIVRCAPGVADSSLALLCFLLLASQVLREWNIKEEKIRRRTKDIKLLLNSIPLQKAHSRTKHTSPEQESFRSEIWKTSLDLKSDHIVYTLDVYTKV